MICTLFLPDFAPAAASACSSTGCLRKCRHHECAWRAGDGAMWTAIIRTACPLWIHRSTRTTIIKQVDAAARDDDVLAEVRWPATRQPHARPSEMMRASYFRLEHRPRRWRSAGTTLGSTSDAGHNPGGVCSGATLVMHLRVSDTFPARGSLGPTVTNPRDLRKNTVSR